jgi:hypothetical protein
MRSFLVTNTVGQQLLDLTGLGHRRPRAAFVLAGRLGLGDSLALPFPESCCVRVLPRVVLDVRVLRFGHLCCALATG